MKAITYSTYGGPEVLSLTEVPAPKVGPAEIRIAVHSASVNPVDWKIVAGYLDSLLEVSFPAIPGWDVSGVVEAVGLDVTEFAVGDEVIAYGRKDWVHGGSFAEQITVPVRTAAHKPASLGWDEAASLPLAGLSAYQTLKRLGVSRGETVLVHAAAGGVGAFAVQIAKAWGARVIGTASPRNHDYLREIGAEPVSYGAGLVAQVRDLVPDGVDVVVDYVGGAEADTMAVLAPGGRHGSIVDDSVEELGGLYMWVRPDAADLAALAALAESGEVKVTVSQTFPLDRAADAFRASMEGHGRGKIVVRVRD
ncbi:NADP-dependent oxidoreductase [Tessaracoccus sp. SD287]|uniref:NADP-dependent oxidoreductase n=1 Tax=Tessaracoccus sp. SD287 TaxID=2782008 RepID=UPI001A961A68|nr:NADP-dependent oxidoreductase [Tessaracoccus sp. SD287]MBO1030583.1 NADP-dependent oxidoreductase [Tessaracoccus sp. SD287]